MPEDQQPVQPPVTTQPEKPKVTEHPISEGDAQKYAGTGDFALPVSPLDELLVKTEGVQPSAKPSEHGEGDESAPVTAPAEENKSFVQDTPLPTAQPVPAVPPPLPDKEESKSETKDKVVDTAMPAPTPLRPTSSETSRGSSVQKVNLEKKAKDMLKELDKPGAGSGGVKPKIKKGGAFTKMALAAVLVVLMGAGGIVGINLLKMQQSAENRSQAGGTAPSGCSSSAIEGPKIGCRIYWYEPGKSSTCNATNQSGCCGDKVDTANNCKRCLCCDNQWVIGSGDSCDAVCKNMNHIGSTDGGTCPGGEDVSPCSCESYPDDCGVNCTFPQGTQNKVGDASQAECKPKIAMCDRNGKVTIVDYKGSACEGKLDQCKNPFADKSCGTPPPATRQDLCVSATKSKSSLMPGESLTITGTASTNVNSFSVAFYNSENLADPSNSATAQPLLIDGQHYIVRFSAPSPTNAHTFTISYADIHKPDGNWGGKIPNRVQFMFYFIDANGQQSLPNGNCWGTFPFSAVSTPPPTAPPTAPPVVISCTSLQKEDKTLTIGDQLTLTCTGSGTAIHHYEFRYMVDGGAWVSATVPNSTSNKSTITVTKKGTYSAECRVCKSADSTSCTTWGQSAQ